MISDYFNRNPCPQYIVIFRNHALSQFVVSEINYQQAMSSYIDKLKEAGNFAEMVTPGKKDMLEVALQCEEKRIEQFNKYQQVQASTFLNFPY